MYNNNKSQIGSCKWPNCSCQFGEVGENVNGQFICANCGHLMNDHFAMNDTENNMHMRRIHNNAITNNATLNQLNQSSVNPQNFNNNVLYNQSPLRNLASRHNNHFSNVNNMNNLMNIRSPMLQNAFDYIRLSSLNMSSVNSVPSNRTQYSSTNNLNNSFNSTNTMHFNDLHSNISQTPNSKCTQQ